MDDLDHLFGRQGEDVREIRDLLVQFIERHEAVMHGGAVCVNERVNTIAFLGHCLGLDAAGLGPAMLARMAFYDSQRRRQTCR
jgi:hypothetical protein